MDKKVQRQLRHDARKRAQQLQTCSDNEFNEFMDYLVQKEVSMGRNISKMNQEIRELEQKPRTRGVTPIGKLETTAATSMVSAGVVALMSMLGGADPATIVVASGITGVVGMCVGDVATTLYDKKPVANAVNDFILNGKRKKLDKLQQEREENEYFLAALEREMEL